MLQFDFSYYTKYFEGKNAGILIGEHALTNYKMWEEQIYNWQSPILNDRLVY